MPLALELAAARVEAFGVKSLASLLDNRFAVLTRGPDTALSRHRTLRATMDWSHDLLSAVEQVILHRLAVLQATSPWMRPLPSPWTRRPRPKRGSRPLPTLQLNR